MLSLLNFLLILKKYEIKFDWQDIFFCYIIYVGDIMYQDRVMLTVKDIFEKEFKLDTRGYRPQEVDKFLDLVMRDYEEFIAINKELASELKALSEDNLKLKQEIRSLRMKLDVLKERANESGTNSVDVLKRLSNLEKIIYGKE